MSNKEIKIENVEVADLSRRVNVLSAFKSPATQVALSFTKGNGLFVAAMDEEVGYAILEVYGGSGDSEITETHIVDITEIKKVISALSDKHVNITVVKDESDPTMNSILFETSKTAATLGTIQQGEGVVDINKISKNINDTPDKDAKSFHILAGRVKALTSIPLGKDAYRSHTDIHTARYTTTFFHVHSGKIKMCRYGSWNAIHFSNNVGDGADIVNLNFCARNETLDTIVNQMASIDTTKELTFIVDIKKEHLHIVSGSDKLKIPINGRIQIEEADVQQFDMIRDNVENTKGTYDVVGGFSVSTKDFADALRVCSSINDDARVAISFSADNTALTISGSGGPQLSVDRDIKVSIERTVTPKDLNMEDQAGSHIISAIESVNTVIDNKDGVLMQVTGLKAKPGMDGYNLLAFKSPEHDYYGVAVWK